MGRERKVGRGVGNESRGRNLGEKGVEGEEEIILGSHFSVFRFQN